MQQFIRALLPLAALAAASPTSTAPAKSGPSCTEFEVDVPVSNVQASTIKVPPFKNSYESVGFVEQTITRTNNPALAIGPTTNLTKSYKIWAQYCEPTVKNDKNGIAQILTHGIGFDRTYWNFGNTTYNYIYSASTAGYPTLLYDRLGVGQSEKPDPYHDVQTNTEIAILIKLTSLLRSGSLPCPSIPKPSKVVHVGHSFGSVLSNGLAATQPDLSDGLVLTGFAHNTSYFPLWVACLTFRLAAEVDGARFGGLSSGYIVHKDQYENQCAFLHYPNFDVQALLQGERAKQPVAVGELVTLSSFTGMAPGFKGPVFYIAGKQDIPFCGGDCTGIIDTAPEKKFFPNASPLEAYIQPNTGHGLNLHYNASAGYQVINNFLSRAGL